MTAEINYDAELQRWYGMQQQLKKLRPEEMELRKTLFAHYFPAPKEGTNDFQLANRYKLKGTYGYDYKVDDGAFAAMKDKLREAGINPDEIVRYKPELVLSKYRKLTEVQRQLLDQCLIIRPSSPSMEIVLPKRG